MTSAPLKVSKTEAPFVHYDKLTDKIYGYEIDKIAMTPSLSQVRKSRH